MLLDKKIKEIEAKEHQEKKLQELHQQQQHQQQNQQPPTNQMEDLQHHLKRTAKRVETLAKDNQLRKAVNFMMQDADQATWNNKNNNLDNEEIHEAKVKNLQSKMLKMEEQNKLEELHHHVTPLNKRLVYETVKKIARGTANGIDAWSRNILLSAMTVDPNAKVKECEQMCTDVYKYVQMCTNMYKCVRMCTNV